MPRPLPMEIRERIIARWKRGGVTAEQLADFFEVSAATVKRYLKLARETGSVEPRSHSGGRPPAIDDAGREWLRQLMLKHQDWTTYEYADAYNAWSGQQLHRSIILRAIHALGFTRKKSQSSRSSATASESRPLAGRTKQASKKSNVRVWFLWTRRAPTSP